MSSLTSEDVVYGPPVNSLPTSLSICPTSPHHLLLLYPDWSGQQQLWQYDPTANEFRSYIRISMPSELSHEELLRRERMRQFSQGITSYSWGKRLDEGASARLLIPMNGKVMIYDPKYEEIFVVYDGVMGAAIDPTWSPNGNLIAFVVNRDLYYLPLPDELKNVTSLTPIRLTSAGAQDGISCGLADYLAQEEMNRFRGYWWSSDSTKIIFEVVDETIVPKFTISYTDSSDPYESESHRYPFAGAANPITGLSIIDLTIPSQFQSNLIPSPHSSDILLPSLLSLPYLNLAGDNLNTQSLDFILASYLKSEDNYICRVDPTPNNNFFVQIQNRLQNTLELVYLESSPPFNTFSVLREQSKIWTNIHDLLTFLPLNWKPPSTSPNKECLYFLWGSELTAYMQLYLYEFDLRTKTTLMINPIDKIGKWIVDKVIAVDPKNSLVYYMGNRDNSTEKHVYVSSLLFDLNIPYHTTRLTREYGWCHDAVVNLEEFTLYGVRSSLTSPPILFQSKFPDLINLLDCPCIATSEYSVLFSNFSPSNEILQNTIPFHAQASVATGLVPSPRFISRGQILLPKLRLPEIQTVEYSHLGRQVQLRCLIYRPDPIRFGNGPYPCVVAVYGGPHVQRVADVWSSTGDMRVQRLVSEGYVVLKCDNRGSSRRGVVFEGAIKHDMGNVEILDQETVVQHFIQQGLVDPARVGIYGWSYGGYMVAMALCKSKVFTCGVSGAPVTSWDGYDTHYTERYMGRPVDNAKGYYSSNVMNYVQNLTGKLLLVHGGIDENVHFRHTSRLITALTNHRKRYELLFFPSERHSPHNLEGGLFMEDRIMEFFSAHC